MKGSELIKKVQAFVELYGDKEIVVAGVFQGGVHSFDIFDGSYYSGSNECILGMTPTVVKDLFVIDEVDA